MEAASARPVVSHTKCRNNADKRDDFIVLTETCMLHRVGQQVKKHTSKVGRNYGTKITTRRLERDGVSVHSIDI